MSRGANSNVAAVSLEQLLALNDEMAALVRAGIPLERGLLDLGREMPGRLGSLASHLGARMQAGVSLSQILEREPRSFPPAWRAVVQAGIKSGHLAAALEGLSRTARRGLEVRRAIALSFVYPLVVLALGYGVVLLLFTHCWPVIQSAYLDLTSRSVAPFPGIAGLGRDVTLWAAVFPVIVVLGFGWWWYRAGRAIISPAGGGGRSFRVQFWRWPSVRQSLRDGRMAAFAELLALMHQQQVPLPEAIVLAADASGDRGLGKASRQIAQQVASGQMVQDRRQLPASFPPLLGWSIIAGVGQSGLGRALRASAEMYRQRASRAAMWSAVYLPIILTAVIGGSVVLVTSLLVFYPISRLLYDLALPF